MATINQIKKQIDTANKHIADYQKKHDMYYKYTVNACNEANKRMGSKVVDITNIGTKVTTYKDY